MSVVALPKRNEINEADTWNLESIYATDDLWQRDFEAVGEKMPGLLAFEGKLGESGQALYAALQMSDKIAMQLEQVYVYAAMRRDEDTTNPKYQALADRAASLYSQVAAAASFITPEIVELDQNRLERFYKDEPRLELYRFMLEQIIEQKPHVRSAEVEAVIAQAGEFGAAPGNIAGMLQDADFKFGTIIDEDGQEVEITNGRFYSLIENPHRRVRKDAFDAYYKTYAAFNNTLATTYAASVKVDIFNARTHNYASSMEAALKPNNIPLDVYSNLVNTVHEFLPALHRYMRVRKRMLKLDELHMYDLYTPLIPSVSRTIPYAEAVETVTQAFAPLGQEYVADMVKGIQSRWIDVYENVGKTSGAYSSGSFTTQPFILMSYQDNLNSLFTLAHELGHSMHSFYTHKTQPYPYANYTIFVAEVASTTNEALLTDYLLKQTNDRDLRLYLINNKLESFRTTLYRQTMFAEFEAEAHRLAEEGEALTPELLNNLYLELNQKYYGPDVVSDPAIAYEWSRIPHFYNAFYVYQYATSLSAAEATSKQILSGDKDAVDRYLNFLKSGARDYSINLLTNAGVDMTTAAPIRQALTEFQNYLDEFEKLADE